MSDKTAYGHIFKTTFVFGFVQVFKAVVSIVKNKLVAILIGSEGVGLMGIFSSTLSLIKTGAGLGIDQSAVRDVSEAYGSNNRERYSQIIYVTTRVVLITGLLGLVVTLVMSRWLSIWTLGGIEYTISYCYLGLGVFLDIMNDGRQALLKGTRQLKSLAYASMIGSFVGLVTAIPLLYFLGRDGIVPSMLISSACALLVSDYYIRKIEYDHIAIPVKETINQAKPMIKMGSAMMLMTFLQAVVALVIQSYIRAEGGLSDVGLYSAGNVILQSYFGVVIAAFMTDYYPRIAAVNNDNKRLQDELNKQSKVSLLICCPMFVFFMAFTPFLIRILYTESFLPAEDFLRYGIYYTIITVCSNQVDLILVAKYKISVFIIASSIIRGLQLLTFIVLYKLDGLEGLGLASMILGISHYVLMSTVVKKMYEISFDKSFYKLFLIVLFLAFCSTFTSFINTTLLRSCIGGTLFLFALSFSYVAAKRTMNLDFIQILINRFKK